MQFQVNETLKQRPLENNLPVRSTFALLMKVNTYITSHIVPVLKSNIGKIFILNLNVVFVFMLIIFALQQFNISVKFFSPQLRL